jgi:hypothetical protein
LIHRHVGRRRPAIVDVDETGKAIAAAAEVETKTADSER